MECEILIKIPQGKSVEEISSNCHSALIAVVLQYSNSLHWSALFSYHIESSNSCSGIYYPPGTILIFSDLKLYKYAAITVVIPAHLWSLPVLLLWSSGCCLSLPTSPTFPFTWGRMWMKQWGFEIGWWTRSEKHHQFYSLCSSPLWAAAFSCLCRKDFCRPQWMLAACWTMQPGTEGMGYWTKTQ